MHNAPLMGRHSFEGNRTTVVTNLLGHAQSQRTQVFFAPLAVVLSINDDTHAMLGAMAYNQADQQLQSGQRLTTSPDRTAGTTLRAC